MNLQTEKLSLINQLINIQDINLIKKVKKLINNNFSDSINLISLERFYAKIDDSEKAFNAGDIITHQALKEEISKWKKRK